jgi:benzoyl-CoA reductase subunit A
MKKCYLGVDLGSTTSKAIIINEEDEIIGRGITNTRANYKVAADIAKLEAVYNARFHLLKKNLEDEIKVNPEYGKYLKDIAVESSKMINEKDKFKDYLKNIFYNVDTQIKEDFLVNDLGSKSQFFRDVVNERYSEELKNQYSDNFDDLMLIFDKSITPIENEMVEFNFKDLVYEAMEILNGKYSGLVDTSPGNVSIHFDAELNLLKGNFEKISDTLKDHINYVADMEIHIANMVGTGYGRALLPFPEDCIKSEILCHAFGAHTISPKTRTVLDIGGQDTKAIQVDSYGLVTSFHMNDRCAAGCGRYLGYIADELNVSLNELGPLALEADKEVNICSTCTVFAGAELRELLNMGEKRENILAGLHKAIIMRAMSLIARSGGVRNEFTFTGGVARNKAVLKYVTELVKKNYGDDLKINIHTDSIFMGALGGAMFARRNINIDLPEIKSKGNLKKQA